jgi:hypothetical protein
VEYLGLLNKEFLLITNDPVWLAPCYNHLHKIIIFNLQTSIELLENLCRLRIICFYTDKGAQPSSETLKV